MNGGGGGDNLKTSDARWSFPWIKVYTDLIGHPKSIALSQELDGAETARAESADGAPSAQERRRSRARMAWAYVVQLWCWCASHAADGRIVSPHCAAIVEDACAWDGQPGELFDSMLGCGFLEKIKGGVAVHDWDIVQGPHFEKARRDAEKKRALRRAQTARADPALTAKTAPSGRADGAVESESEIASSKEEAAAQAKSVFEYWRSKFGKNGRTIFDARRKRAVQNQLKAGRTLEDLKLAIDGCKASHWHQGENKEHKVHDDLELICRDAKHVEEFQRVASKQQGEVQWEEYQPEGADEQAR